MPSTKEIKDHIKSVRDTQKITNAMYLIASTKMRKARQELDDTRPYFTALKAEIKRIFRTAGDLESRYFYPADGSPIKDADYGCLVITADKGLAGAYNQNVLKETQVLMDLHPGMKLWVVGEYGRQYFAKKHIPVEQSFLYTAQNPTIGRARQISATLLDQFDRDLVDKIYVVYTDMKNSLECEAKSTRILPFHRTHFATSEAEKAVDSPFEFTPSVKEVLENVMQSYVTGFIYSALVTSFCCEQSCRMAAMDASNRNAEKILSELSTQYNRVRQAAITQEITEVSAGALAQRRKRQKKEIEENAL